MPVPPPPTPTERFATIIQWITRAVGAQTGWGLSLQLIALITGRLRRIIQRFRPLAARVQAGRYAPRRRAARPPGRPVPADKLPREFGWLLKLLPEAVGYRAQLESLLRDPEMAALLAAAPAPMGRVLRPLCRMLGLAPPPILATPPPPAAPKKPQTPPPHPPRQTSRPAQAQPKRPPARGPPLPA